MITLKIEKSNIVPAFITALLFISVDAFCQQPSFSSEFENFISSDKLTHASVSFSVVDTEAGQAVFSHDPNRSLIPASSLKIATTATALMLFGPDHVFKTQFGYDGEIASGKLHGDLYIIGGGDPCLGSPRFEKTYSNFMETWCQGLTDAGVKSISGDVVVVDAIFEGPPLAGSTSVEDSGNYYGGGAYGVNYLDNTYALTFKTGKVGELSQITGVEPIVFGLAVRNEVVASSVDSDRAYIYGGAGMNSPVVRGTLPAGKEHYQIQGAIPNPAFQLGMELSEKLNSFGIEFKGMVEVINEPSSASAKVEGFKLLAETASPELEDIVKTIHKESVNLYSDVLIKYIGFMQNGSGSFQAGAQAVSDFWKSKSIDVTGWNQKDGSGLSRANTISADQLTQMARIAITSGKVDFNKSLKPLGKTGKIVAKSGYIEGVRSYVGYIETENETLAFCIIVNHYEGSPSGMRLSITSLLEKLL
jgi:D-alanyl-D-alanine carboxypeptidase/D-alanyl-D-alanine-endopeptidase (penicillin-binding protein 4)